MMIAFIEICLLLILLEMTKIDEDVGELIDDVTLEDVVGLKNFLSRGGHLD